MKTQSFRKALAFSAASLLAVSLTHAAPVTVNNFSFEATTGTSVPTSWTAYNEGSGSDIGAEQPGGSFAINHPLGSPADGNNFCYINMFNSSVTGGIYQDTGVLLANTTYTLTVAIGHRSDLINGGPNSPGIISLVNAAGSVNPFDGTGGLSLGSTLLGTAGGLPATAGTWQDYTVTFTTGNLVSGDLYVALSVLGNGTSIQGPFDNVRLDAAAAPVPEPASLALLGGGLLSLLAIKRRRSAAKL